MTGFRAASGSARHPRRRRSRSFRHGTPQVARALPFAVVASLAGLAPALSAQDFATSAESAPATAPAAMLDSALPPRGAAPGAEAFVLSRFALSALATRGAAAGLGWRSLRVAAGISQTGDPDIGWVAAGVACGVVHHAWGAGLRAVARRDQDPLARWRSPHGGSGAECGGAVWFDLARDATLWASAPQVWAFGVPPPLARGLTTGIRIGGPDARAWIAHEARPATGTGTASHRAGFALGAGVFALRVEGFDGPLRAAIGVEAGIPLGRVHATMESHPVLGESVHLGIVLGMRAPGPGDAP